MTPRFFIDRPIFSWVIALAILLAGGLALRALPIEQYPSIAPPSLTVSVTYPGADAAALEANVTQVLEQELNGIEGFRYMSATSRSNGNAQITVTFEPGTDLDVAVMNVQSRLRAVEPRLPEEVRRQGVTVRKASDGFLMVVTLSSESGTMSAVDLGNFAYANVRDELLRIDGVGDMQLFASQYAMRIWLDPDKLAAYRLSAADALSGVREQNAQSPGGALGAQPVAGGSELNASIVTRGRLTTPEEFGEIILRANPDGSVIRLADVGRVELGAQNYVFGMELNGKPAAGMGIAASSAMRSFTGGDALPGARRQSAGRQLRRGDLSRNVYARARRGARLLETSMNNLIVEAYQNLTGADVALSHGWRFAPPIPPGPLTAGDLWTMVPTNPEIETLRMTGRQLHSLIEANLHSVFAGDPLQQAGGYVIRARGLSLVFRPNNGRGTRIEHLEIAGTPYQPERSYTVAAAGIRGIPESVKREGTGVRAIEALRRHLSKGEVHPAVTGRTFIAQ